MYRNFMSSYNPPYSGYRYLPYNFHRGYFYAPYNNYINSNFANVNQRLYNYGSMSDVYQQSYIMQSSARNIGICTDSNSSGICTELPPSEYPILDDSNESDSLTNLLKSDILPTKS